MEQAKRRNLINYQTGAKEGSNTKFLTVCSWLYFVAFFLLPDNCGFYFKALFSAKRIMMFVCYALIIFNNKYLNEFVACVRKVKVLNIFVILYMGVRALVAVYRRDINSFTNEFLDGVMVVYLFYFILHKYISVKKFLKFLEITLYIICIAGFVEFFVGFNVFSLFETIGGRVSPMRGGFLRIYGNCHHPILCGVYVTILFFLTCMDYDNKNFYLFRKPWLFVLSLATVFMTGSRGPIGIFLASIILCVLLSKKNEMIKSIIILGIIALLFVVVLIFTINTEFGRYIMRMITSAIDGIFGTSYSLAYGGEIYSASTEYRVALNKVFSLTYFNPLIGRGFSYNLSVVIDGIWLRSCDNTYVMTYIQYAYPGLILLVTFFAIIIVIAFIGMIKHKDKSYASFVVVVVGYMCNIYIVAFMGTFMYMWMVFALALIMIQQSKQKKEIENGQSNN